jgi:hypothetical protein
VCENVRDCVRVCGSVWGGGEVFCVRECERLFRNVGERVGGVRFFV